MTVYKSRYRINPAILRTKIAIKRVIIEKDEDNIARKVFKEIYSCKANVTSYKDKEDEESGGKIFVDEKKVIMRVPKKIKLIDTDSIVINCKDYNITSLNDIEELGLYYELKVRYSK